MDLFTPTRSRRRRDGPKLRCLYRIERYSCGDFIGEILKINQGLAQVRVVDTLRPAPRVLERCCYPQCILSDFHLGEHEFASIRLGAVLDIPLRLAKWVPLS